MTTSFSQLVGNSMHSSQPYHHQTVVEVAEAPILDPLTMVPALSPHLHEAFGGPHTQFAAACFYCHPTALNLVPSQVVVSCTQLFLCDADSFVIRVCHLNKLLAMYHRDIPATSGGNRSTEMELLLVLDREHDLLLRGQLICDGAPAKPLLQTLLALQKLHCPTAPVALHMNSTVPLKDVGKLKPPLGYVAPLPQREETWENCPCWRAADVLNISDDEFATRLRNMCIVYCPEKLPSVPDLCIKYQRRKGGVLQHMVQQYGPEPTEDHAMAVYKVLQREEKFADILRTAASVLPSRRNHGRVQASDFMGNAATSSGGTHGGVGGVPLSKLMNAQKKFKESLIPAADPLFFPVLKLIDQPSGGHGRLHVRVKPVPFVQVQQDVIGMFCRRPTEPEFEFWYLTNEGYVLPFDIAEEVMQPFGYQHGDRVLATWGVTRGRWSTVVGVRDGTLWVQDDGDHGASALIGFSSRDDLERCNGWIKQERVSSPLRETIAMIILTLPESAPKTLIITPEVVFARCGFYHGEVVRCCDPCSIPFEGVAVIAGVDADDEQTVFVFFIDPSDEGLTQEVLLNQQLRQQRQIAKHRDDGVSQRDALDNNPSNSPGNSGAAATTAAAVSPLSQLRNAAHHTSSKRVVPSRAAAQPLYRCRTPEDVRHTYGWKSIGAARVLQYTTATRPSSVIL
ncbi:Hypothetical protein, putative [Bodo saltans]|uniref:Uncharacterized protein n=1 Tax=Bodo saltans TaxID=75058 RepID=A0A0S4IPJ2_BODSA|nr:Hypothetical protein, putative [Bodo saltans]|eukprot:CUF04307.1 Hypothetical protein, putative [Bodo saltans]